MKQRYTDTGNADNMVYPVKSDTALLAEQIGRLADAINNMNKPQTVTIDGALIKRHIAAVLPEMLNGFDQTGRAFSR